MVNWFYDKYKGRYEYRGADAVVGKIAQHVTVLIAILFLALAVRAGAEEFDFFAKYKDPNRLDLRRIPDTDHRAMVILCADKTTVKLGEPVLVNLYMFYTGVFVSDIDFQIVVDEDRFLFKDANGVNPPYIEWPLIPIGCRYCSYDSDYETVLKIKHFQRHIDISDKYLLTEPGRYTVQFLGDYDSSKQIVFQSSNELVLIVEPGELQPADKLIAQVLPVCPKDWRICKGHENGKLVAPAHRKGVPGTLIHLQSPDGVIGCTGTMTLWQTNVPAELASDDKAKERYPEGPAEYLGQGPNGYLYAYVCLNPKSKHKWEDPIGTLKNALVTGK